MSARDEAFKALESLSPATVFLDSYRMKRLPEDLDIYFGPPEEFFLAHHTQKLYTEDKLIPILDDGNFGVVTFLDPATGTLIQKNVEAPTEVWAAFSNWQQYLADLFIRMVEVIEDDEELGRVAELIGFRHAGETMQFLGTLGRVPPGEYERARRDFISGIAG